MNLERELARLNRLSVPELRAEYSSLFGEETRSGNKRHLIRRIAWKLQCLTEGDLSARARRRAALLANDADLRKTAPRIMKHPEALKMEASLQSSHDSRLPMPGAVLTRVYKGKTLRVTVLPKGFEYRGKVYRTLSAVAKAATGGHWSGYHFFGLNQKGEKNDSKE